MGLTKLQKRGKFIYCNCVLDLVFIPFSGSEEHLEVRFFKLSGTECKVQRAEIKAADIELMVRKYFSTTI